MANERPFTKVWNDILNDTRVSREARFLYILLKQYEWDTPMHRGIYPGQERLAQSMGSTTRFIQKYLKELVACGLITVERRGLGLTNLYYLNDVVSFPECTPDTPEDTRIDETTDWSI